MKDYALVTYFDSAYAEGFKILIRSFLKFNPWYDADLIIFDWGLTQKEIEECSKYYDKTVWTNVDKNKYSELNPDKHYFSQCFLKGDIFTIRGYKKIIVIDADLIVIGDISPLFNEYNEGIYYNHISSETDRPNTGLMVISAEYLTDVYYQRYLEEMGIEINRDTENSMSNSNENIFKRLFPINLLKEEHKYRLIENYIPDVHKIIGWPLIKPWGYNKMWIDHGITFFPEKERMENFYNLVKTKKLIKKLGI